jgi:FKBP-type peptidyl-prolyl cis-trans isomerase FkpA
MHLALKTIAIAPALFAASAAQAQTASPILPMPLNPVVDAGHRTCAAKAPSGLGYTILKPAAAGAAKPGDEDVVLINYLGYLSANGEVFDQATRTPMPVSGVIAGFSEGLKLAAKGSVLRLCIPSAMGYGAEGSGPIPANSDLVFQIELIDFKSLAEIEAMRKAQGGIEGGDASPPSPPPAPKP